MSRPPASTRPTYRADRRGGGAAGSAGAVVPVAGAVPGSWPPSVRAGRGEPADLRADGPELLVDLGDRWDSVERAMANAAMPSTTATRAMPSRSRARRDIG